jgi:hypothetical protein
VPLIALIAPFAQVARSTNRSTTAAPDPLVLLLYVTSQAEPGLHRRERGPVRQEPGAQPDAIANITNRGSRRARVVQTAGLAARRASIVA